MKWLYLAIGGLLLGLVWFWPDNKLHVIVCDVGQGDGVIISLGKAQVLIDGGSNDMVLDCLSSYMPFWDRQIELVVMTNADSDHMTGLIEVFRVYEVDRLVANNLYKDSARFEAFRNVVVNEGVEVFGPKRGDRFVINSDLVMGVLWPDDRLGDSLVWFNSTDERVLGENTYSKNKGNEQSVVFSLKYGDFEMLFTGDVGKEVEDSLRESGVLSNIEVLKVGHHGSKFSTSDEFLDAIDPELAVISVGKNSYGHPTEEALDRLRVQGVEILRTDEEGDIEIISDGKGYWIR